jgi:meiotic recombination protein SPO11
MALKTIDILIENLENQYIATRRDIYYQDVDLFVNQRNIDSIVSVICTSLQYKDYEIGAVAAQKGLFWGEVTLVNQGDDDDDDTRQCFKSAENGVMLIPRLHNVEKIEVSDTIEYVLIIEKEAVFNALCNYSGFNSNRIMITGKGFPDVLTKTFVSRIARDNPGLMIWGIADLDPYGINILRQYKNGGAVNASLLKNELLEAISCPSLKPLRFSIVDFIGNKSSLSDLNTREAGIIISNFRKWRELKSTNDDDQFNSFARRELQRMMFFGKKCELNTIKMNRHEDEHGLVGTVKYIDELCLSRRAN